MPATLTRPKTAIRKPAVSQGLKRVATQKKTATITKKNTIDELGKRAQDIISKYDIKPFNRSTLYGNL
ncbi:hypothetical protein [Capnocytophaga granulosa]